MVLGELPQDAAVDVEGKNDLALALDDGFVHLPGGEAHQSRSEVGDQVPKLVRLSMERAIFG
jgi:hypothetical protein